MNETNKARLAKAKKLIEQVMAEESIFNSEKGICIEQPYLAVLEFQTMLLAEEREVFAVLFLDNKHHLLKAEKMFYGTINQAAVHPREIVKRALELNSAAIIIAHNHPSGDPTPSEADHYLTRKVKMACDLVEIRFVDHIIIGRKDYYSFTEEKAYNS